MSKSWQPPTPPADLSPESREAWPRLAADVCATLGGAEVDIIALGDMLRLRDRIAAVRAAIAADGPTVAGSRKQVRPNPLLAVELSLQRQVADAMRRLRLDGYDRHRVGVASDGRLVKTRGY